MKYAISLQHLVIRKQYIQGKYDVMIRIYPISLLVLLSALASHFGQAQELQLVLPVGHPGCVNSAQFSLVGKTICTASCTKPLKFLTWLKGRNCIQLKGIHQGRITPHAL